MHFIGRKAELAFLERCYAKPSAQLVVVYGRRRVGKTECLRQFAQGKPCLWYSCTKNTDALQLKGFSRRLLALDPVAARFTDSFASWRDALEEIPRLDLPGRKLVIVDEFPYAVEGNPALPSILQGVWDELLCREDVMVVLCGSSMSLMENELLSEKNPLYGRATGVWRMEPLGFDEAQGFFPGYTPQERLEAYGILGGVPHYLRQFDPDLPIGRNVCENVLARGCALHTEADFLLRQELREPAVYNAVLGAVAAGAASLSDVAGKTMLDTRTANTYLRKLEELRIVEREFSVQDGQQERSKATRGHWRLCDNFLAFWYAAVRPHLSELDVGGEEGVWESLVSPRLNAHLSPAFEDVCRQWLRRRCVAGELPFRYTAMGRWWHKTAEVDIVALGEESSHLLGECKFKNSPVGPSVLADLRAKEDEHFPRGEGWLWLFSKAGYTDGGSWAAGEDRVRLVGAEELGL